MSAVPPQTEPLGAEPEPRRPRPRWLALLTIVALAAVGGVILWSLGSPEPTPTPGPSSSSTSPTSPSPTVSESRTPTTLLATLPAYVVGSYPSGSGTGYGLYREFRRVPVTDPSSDEVRAVAALRLSMNPSRLGSGTGYLTLWTDTEVTGVTVTPDLITVTLSGPGQRNGTREQDRLAVQQLVWTAQAAVGKGTIPVTFSVADGSTELFGRLPAAGVYNRPTADQLWRDLAPIWITVPERGQRIPSGDVVPLQGQASVFEATVSWAVLANGKVVAKGFTTATEGAPARGTYQVDVGKLPDGDYVARVWEASAKDGSPIGTVEMPFSVG